VNLKRCDRCKHTVESYRLPTGWHTVPRYEMRKVSKKKGARPKRIFVDFSHLCSDCPR